MCAQCRYPRFVGQKITPDQLLLLSFPVSNCSTCYCFEGFVEVRHLLACINLCCREGIWTTSPGCACASSRTGNTRLAGTNCPCHYVSISIVVGTIWPLPGWGKHQCVPSLCLWDKTSAKKERQRIQKASHVTTRLKRQRQPTLGFLARTAADDLIINIHAGSFTAHTCIYFKTGKIENALFSEEERKWSLSNDDWNQQDILALSFRGVNVLQCVLITASIQRWRNSLLVGQVYNTAK